MPDAIVSTADGRIKVVPFGSDALTPLVSQAAGQVELATAQVALATTQAGIATTQAGIATAAVASTFQNAGRYIPITEPLEEGGFFADFSIPAGITFTRLFARILDGSGSVDVTVLDDGYPVHGPITVDFGTDTDDTISETIATGSDISFFLDNITGAPMGLIVKVEGAPA